MTSSNISSPSWWHPPSGVHLFSSSGSCHLWRSAKCTSSAFETIKHEVSMSQDFAASKDLPVQEARAMRQAPSQQIETVANRDLHLIKKTCHILSKKVFCFRRFSNAAGLSLGHMPSDSCGPSTHRMSELLSDSGSQKNVKAASCTAWLHPCCFATC